MTDATLQFEYFAFATGQHGGQEVIDLSGERSGGRLAHGSILFEQFMVFFHFLLSLVNRGELCLIPVSVAVDQTQDSLATVLICKDLSGYVLYPTIFIGI